ncbi:MAG: AIR synthase-related protein [Candidatus Bathyarchaeota archaeon]|nr:AIR synthase-related protein [Candidatus Bathyarchaeota archaeon]
MGKLSTDELKKILTCIKPDSRVTVPPQVGFDAGVHRIGDRYVVVAADPCVGVPEDWFGYLLIHYAASDVSLFGAKPEFCTVTLMGPRPTDPQKFVDVMKQTCQAADDLDIAIVRGHTGTYDGISELVGVCTVYGTVAPGKLITPENARPNDLVLCTKPVGLETVVNFALTHKAWAQELFGKAQAEKLSGQVPMQSCVREAMQLAQTGRVHAMHDATEGGFVSALNELTEASKLGFQVDFEKLPIPPEALILQETFGLSDEQVLAMSSTGTVMGAVDPKAKENIQEALRHIGVHASFIGEFTENKSCTLIKKGKETRFPETAVDPYSRIMSGKA